VDSADQPRPEIDLRLPPSADLAASSVIEEARAGNDEPSIHPRELVGDAGSIVIRQSRLSLFVAGENERH
jgi:hypothetical protein